MARTGLADIRNDLRGMTAAGTADWTSGTALTYFDDDMLDSILDRHYEAFVFEGMEAEEPYKLADGTFEWTVYETPHQNIEADTAFYIQDQSGGTVAAADYDVDYRLGYVTFNANTLGKPYYATGYAYDINAAAADIWELKANHVANAFDFSTDNHNLSRSQIYKQYMERMNYYRGKSDGGSGGGQMVREDTDAC
jgi:hypothetical protein